ncbi:MAG: beta-galactosidase [Myxococcota bacterium]
MRWYWIVALAGCSGKEDSAASVAQAFPDGFLWGSATAGFQVDMGCPTWSAAECDDPNSDWYQWVTESEIIDNSSLYVSGQPVADGPGMWELFEEDVARMESDGLTAYRMSLEWSRLFPEDASSATTVADLAALADSSAVARYHDMLSALQGADIEPLVTVNHYTLPLWVHDGLACHNDLETCEASGWVDGDRMIPLITLFTGWAAAEFGGEVRQWATLNEPFATTLSGYLAPGEDRSAPPGLLLAEDAVIATLRNQIVAHARMYDAIHENDDDASVGIVLNMVAVQPKDPDSADDVASVANMDHLYHRLFLDGLTAGSWDDDLDGSFEETRPELAGRLDWVGVNYYNQVTVASWVTLLDGIPVFDFLPEFSWDAYPEGLEEVVGIAAEYGLPIIVTENGTPNVEQADDILDGHLEALHRAIEAGADVRGYYYWSFIDNYEWNHGLDLRFGLYALDAETKERSARPVLERYREIISANGL